MAESARARREAEQQMRAKQIENEVAEQRMAEKSAAADELLRFQFVQALLWARLRACMSDSVRNI
jgi:hypothetical protein